MKYEEFTVYPDWIEATSILPPEQFKSVWTAIGRWAKTGRRMDFENMTSNMAFGFITSTIRQQYDPKLKKEIEIWFDIMNKGSRQEAGHVEEEEVEVEERQEEGGWVKLFRSFRKWQHYQEPVVAMVFIDLLLSANTKDTWYAGHKIHRGELVTTDVEIMSHLNIKTHDTVRLALRKLVASGEIRKEFCNRRTKITIVNYENYQNQITKKS